MKKTYTILMATDMRSIDNDIPKVYVEYTWMTLEQRKKWHYLNFTILDNPFRKFHHALKYIGAQHFNWEILDVTQNEKKAKKLVEYYIKEYQSDTIGYNNYKNPDFCGEKNFRYGDHRTWEEIHGKEKADYLKRQKSLYMSSNQEILNRNKIISKVWNPMDVPEYREKVRQSKMGTKNPNACVRYIFTKPDGTEIVAECMREFCRENEGFSRLPIRVAYLQNRPYKGMTIRREYKV